MVYTANCGSCDNQYFGSKSGVGTITAARILNNGWELLPNDKPNFTGPQVSKEKINDIVNKTLKSVDGDDLPF